MMSLLDSHTYTIGCEHKSLAVITVNMVDQSVDLSLLLEDKTVTWIWWHTLVRVREDTERG